MKKLFPIFIIPVVLVSFFGKSYSEQGKIENSSDSFSNNRLISYAEHGNIQGVKELLESGISPDVRDNFLMTPLMWAALRGHEDVVKLLLQYKADVNIRDRKGKTALYAAAWINNEKIVKLLLEKGADVNARDQKGRTVLNIASGKNPNGEIVKVLPKYGAEIKTEDDNGNTPLMAAASQGHIKVVEMLIEGGAEVNAQNSRGDTAYMLAEQGGHQETAQYLLSEGANEFPWMDKDGNDFLKVFYKEGSGGEGIVEGKIIFKGIPPPPKLFPFGKHPNEKYCSQFDNNGKGNRFLKEVSVEDGKLQDVVLYIKNIENGKPMDFKKTEVIAKNCRFIVQGGPSQFVGIVVNGGAIKITNLDADPDDPKSTHGLLTNPHSYEKLGNSLTTMFNLPLPIKGGSIIKRVKLRKEDKGSVLYLESDNRNYMNAYFYPVKNPYYAIVGPEGTYSIDQVPPGNYTLLAWHPILGTQEKEIEVPETGKVVVDFEFTN